MPAESLWTREEKKELVSLRGRREGRNVLHGRLERQPSNLDEIRKREDREHAIRRLDEKDGASLLVHHHCLLERRPLVLVLRRLRSVDVIQTSDRVPADGNPQTCERSSSVDVLGRLERLLLRRCELELLRGRFERVAVLIEDEGGEGVSAAIGVLDEDGVLVQQPAAADVRELEDAGEAGRLGDEEARRTVEICGEEA